MKSITAIAPATVANVGPGFDVLGFALLEPFVKITAQLKDKTENQITISSTNPNIPIDPTLNTAGVATLSLLSQLQSEASVSLHIDAGIPMGSGLGSSAASAVAAAVAVNALLGSPLKTNELLNSALDGEGVVSGARHADNVAPCLLGGFVVIRRHDPPDWIHVTVPKSLRYVVVYPQCTVNTADARRVLPQTVPLNIATQQWANVAMLVAALNAGDTAAAGRALEDGVAEPARAALIPGYNSVKQAALSAGALGCTISGSGPSMLAFAASGTDAKKIGVAMVEAFCDAGLPSRYWTGQLQNSGAKLL